MGETYIYHYGIKGMKWGVRRTPAQLGHRKKRSLKDAVNAIKKKTEATAAAKEASKPKSVKDMSDDELRRVLNRINMEKQYNQYLNESNQKKQSRAKKLIADILESGAKTMASKAVEAAAKKLFDKPNEKDDPITDYFLRNPEKASDKQLKNASERAKNLLSYYSNMDKLDAKLAERQAGIDAVQNALERMGNKPFRDVSVTIDDEWLAKRKR